MKLTPLSIIDDRDLIPMVAGRVFHATSAANMELIRESSALVPNLDLLHHSMYGYSDNGFFRKRGCVSFFDYRCFGTPYWKDNAFKCFPTQNLEVGESMSILFLRESEYEMLIPWTTWRAEKTFDRVVPWVEAGYKGEVPLRHICEEMVVRRVNCE